jgi:hypothetical protein
VPFWDTVFRRSAALPNEEGEVRKADTVDMIPIHRLVFKTTFLTH